jgi:diguanylate cyclase (GGDEF)-like protein
VWEGAATEATDATAPQDGQRWWIVLHRDRVWTEVMAELERHVRRRTGADRVLVWLRLPPAGHWLRWEETLEPEIVGPAAGPYGAAGAAGVPGAATLRLVTAATGPPEIARQLERLGLAEAWLVPLVAPPALAAEEPWYAVLALAWRSAAPATAPDLPVFTAGIWYLLKERLEAAYTDAVVDAALGPGPPVGASEWSARMPALLDLMGGDHWALYRVTDRLSDHPTIALVAESGRAPGRGQRLVAFMTAEPERLARSALMQAARQERSVFVPDVLATDYAITEAFGGEPVRSGFVLPLGEQEGSGFGILSVYWLEPNGWRRLGLSFAPWEAFRRLAAEWWQAMHAAQDATHDALTGLANRRGLRRAWESAARRWPAGWLAVVDADRFSDVNDRWGHLIGDAVLRVIADAVRREAQTRGGFGARWGGDEFVVCAPGAWEDDVLPRALRSAVDREARRLGLPVRIGLSGGTVAWRGDAPALDDAFDRADRLLLAAKHAGRGRFFAE